MRNTVTGQRRRFTSRPQRNKKASTIDPNLLIKKATDNVLQPKAYVSARTFDEMPIDQKLKNNLAKKGYQSPTEIQDKSIESLIEGRDMVGIAKTGTGKTGAFLLPIIHQLLNSKPFTSLVIVPTRELAQQVEEEFRSFTNGLGFYVTTLIGGTNVNQDIARLNRKNHLIVGTPGRLLDMANRKALKLNQINTLVLDEYDRMLDMGFVNDIKRIVAEMPQRKQTMLFSATLDNSQKKLIDELVTNAIEIKTTTGTTANELVDQSVIKVKTGEDKFLLLMNLIAEESFERVIIFTETKHQVDKLSKKLNQSGVPTGYIHGGKTQNFRTKSLQDFKRGTTKILVATDVAARGIDINDVSHVINYQLPTSMDSYVHRIGRTGRAGKKGTAYTFVD